MSKFYTQYEATVYHTSTGSSHTKLYGFTQDQANEVGAVMHALGMPEWAALKLIEKWNKRGGSSGIRYSYALP